MATPKQAALPTRSAGILLHPTSLPGPYGIGDLGAAAYAWVDALARARQTWWQVLPLGPTGYGDSPYQSFSAFGGNPYLLSPQLLVRDGLLRESDLDGIKMPGGPVDYGRAIQFKKDVLGQAWENFRAGSAPSLRPQLEEFCVKQAAWLKDYALFMAIKDAEGGKSWMQWPADVGRRKPAVLARARRELAKPAAMHEFW